MTSFKILISVALFKPELYSLLLVDTLVLIAITSPFKLKLAVSPSTHFARVTSSFANTEIGKIAKIFRKLGAQVIVAARRAEVREQIQKDGFVAIGFEHLQKNLLEVGAVINTVPSLVMTEDCIRCMPRGSLIVDIASKPGGTDFEAAKKYGVAAKLALGLPGIYTTTSSARLLKNAITKYAPLKEDISEDKLWIFQIVI
mgnify:CR=1 FL=1